MNYVNIKVNIYSKFSIVEISNSKNNALDTKTIIELVNCLKKLSKNETLSCIAIKGNNKFFSPGADIKELSRITKSEAKKSKLFSHIDEIQKIKIPIIALVEGYALGGGFELALTADIIIASENAKFGLPEINIGLIPGIGGTQKLKKVTSKKNIKYLAMSGNIIDSITAKELGIVSLIFKNENFNDESINFLKNISSKPKFSLQEIKRLINLDFKFKKALKEERNTFYKLLDSKNKKIGIQSFLKKKIPEWE